MVADLQSHTHRSHDSLVPPEDLLTIQGKRGIEVTGVTEHKDPAGAFTARQVSRSASDFPIVIPGVELSTPDGYVLGLGLNSGKSLPEDIDSQKELAQFVRTVHEEHSGAVISLSWKLDTSGVKRMIEAGVDGFEIVNMGHPDVPQEVSRFIRQKSIQHDLTLVASSDWHGWTGMWRTWSLIRVSGKDRDSVAESLVTALRKPQQGKVLPVVAGYLGPPSQWRVVFAPFIEAFRYAAELSPSRVLGWWLWIGLALLCASMLRSIGLKPARFYFRTGLTVIGVLLLFRTVPLALAPAAVAADPAFHLEIGRYGVLLGGLTLLLGIIPLGFQIRGAVRAHGAADKKV